MADFVPYTHPCVTRVYTTKQLVDQLFANLRTLAGTADKNSYIAGYLSACLADIAEKGVDELTAIVDYTNQRIDTDELRTTVRELERKHAQMEDRLAGDGK